SPCRLAASRHAWSHPPRHRAIWALFVVRFPPGPQRFHTAELFLVFRDISRIYALRLTTSGPIPVPSPSAVRSRPGSLLNPRAGEPIVSLARLRTRLVLTKLEDRLAPSGVPSQWLVRGSGG